MTQEQKDLLLKDLYSRLPYGVKVDCTDGVVQLECVDFELGYDKPVFWYGGNGTNLTIEEDNIKPYLFPLSSMTDEQKRESPFESSLLNAFINGYISLFEDEELTIDDLNRLYDWFNKNHFDYRGLIPLGLAKDATNLNIY